MVTKTAIKKAVETIRLALYDYAKNSKSENDKKLLDTKLRDLQNISAYLQILKTQPIKF